MFKLDGKAQRTLTLTIVTTAHKAQNKRTKT